MIALVSPVIASGLGAVVGALVALLVLTLVRRRRTPPPPEVPDFPVADLVSILDAVRAGATLLGPHDDIVCANETAEKMGVVRGTRVVIPALLDLVRDVRRNGEMASVNLDLKKGRGRTATGAQLSVRVLPLSLGRVFVVADDRAQALRMRESSRNFMSNATHELKTPVGAISLLAEAAREAADDPEAVGRFTGKIMAESQRLTDLISQIITLSKLQGESPLAAAEPVEVNQFVSLALDRCRQLADARDVSLTSSLQEGLWVLGDPGQLVTAVSNLVTNGIAYSDARGRVVVSTRTSMVDGVEHVDVAVSDNGIGIAPEDQARIFERFYRADYARSRETGGTGLGLSIVSEVAEGHGGTVTVWSRLGSGSTFTLRLPSVAAPDTEPEEDQ